MRVLGSDRRLTRRAFVAGAGGLAASLYLLGSLSRSAEWASTDHPRLIYTAADWSALKAKIATSPYRECYDRIDALRPGMVSSTTTPPLSAASWDLNAARTFRDRAVTLGAFYRLNPTTAAGQAAADRVVEDVVGICAGENTVDWAAGGNDTISGAGTQLAMGEVATGVALGYDWCYDRFTGAQRTTAESGAIQRGLDEWFDNYDFRTHNWSAVIGGGIGLLLMALRGEATPTQLPEGWTAYWIRLDRWLRNGVFFDEGNGMPTPPGKYTILNRDGGYKEGPGYLGYYMEHLTAFLAAHKSCFGTMHPVYEEYPVHTAVDFYRHCVGPNEFMLRFSDGEDMEARREKAAWTGFYARHLDSDHYRGVHAYSRRFDGGAEGYTGDSAKLLDGSDAALWMMWYDGPGKTPAALGKSRDALYRHTAVFASRSAWDDTQALYVGGRLGGDVDKGHTHLDRGSFVLQAQELNYIVDLGENVAPPGSGTSRGRWYDDYEFDSAGNTTSENGARWRYYKTRAEGHNTLVIDPGPLPDQRTGPGTANLVPVILKSVGDFNGIGAPMFVTDLTPVYSGRGPWLDVRRVHRGFKMIDRRYLIVQSEIDAVAPVNVWDFYHAESNDNGVELLDIPYPKTAVVRKVSDGRKLVVKILSEQGTFSAPMAADYLADSADVRPADNGGMGNFEKLGINVTAPTLTLCVALVPTIDGAALPAFPAVTPLVDW